MYTSLAGGARCYGGSSLLWHPWELMQLDNNNNSNYNNLDSLWGELPPLAPLRADAALPRSMSFHHAWSEAASDVYIYIYIYILCTTYLLCIIISTTTITIAFWEFSEHSRAAQANYYRRSRISEHRKRGAVLCTGRCWLLCFVHCLLPSLPSLLLYVVVACNLGLRRTGTQSCHCSRHCVMSGCYIPWGRLHEQCDVRMLEAGYMSSVMQ